MGKFSKQFIESRTFILKNENALSSEVPLRLVEYWLTNDLLDIIFPYNRLTDQFLLFEIALMKYKFKGNIDLVDIEPRDLSEMYGHWQIALSTIGKSKMKDIKVAPFKLFDFDNLKNFKVVISNKHSQKAFSLEEINTSSYYEFLENK